MDPVELLYEMVKIRSYTGEEGELACFLLELASRLEFDEAYIDKAGNFIAVRGTGKTSVYLVGHMDTVSGWIEPRIDGGYIHGRGSVDAKGPLAAFISAVADFRLPPHLKVVVVGAVAEEGDSKGALFLLETMTPPSYLVIGEPSGVDGITLGYKGSLFLRKEIVGEVSHSASGNPGVIDEGLEAIFKMRRVVDILNEGRDKAWDRIDMRVKEILSESDGLKEKIRLAVSARVPYWVSPDEFLELAGNDWRIAFKAPAYKSDRANPLVSAFNRAIRKRGFKAKFKLKSGTSDMNLLAPVWGCPAIAYGPGDSSLDHTPHERISIEEYLISIEVLKEALGSIPPTL